MLSKMCSRGQVSSSVFTEDRFPILMKMLSRNRYAPGFVTKDNVDYIYPLALKRTKGLVNEGYIIVLKSRVQSNILIIGEYDVVRNSSSLQRKIEFIDKIHQQSKLMMCLTVHVQAKTYRYPVNVELAYS